MCLNKVLLLFFITTMHITLMVSQLQRSRNHYVFPLCNLKRVENSYVQQLFKDVYREETLEPLDGITFPVGNNVSETLKSMCAISHYLNQTEMVRALIPNPNEIISNVKVFQKKFKRLKKEYSNQPDHLTKCHIENSTLTDNSKKVFILRILYFSRKWTEDYLNVTCNTTHF